VILIRLTWRGRAQAQAGLRRHRGPVWYCLPRGGGEPHRLVGTEWEPYVAVSFCSGFALSFTMILSAVIAMIG
jgi:hypothetical protein